MKLRGATHLPALLLACLAWATSPAAAVPLELRVTGPDGRPLGDAVVLLRSTSPSRRPADPLPAVMDQRNRRFVPEVLIVPVGSPVSFPNSDAVSHQVYSFSPIRRFQLPLYRGKPHAPVLFETPGIVTLGCNIHDDMRAYVVVSDGQYAGSTDERGLWRSADVEADDYTLLVWHPLTRETRSLLEQRVTVPRGTVTQVVDVRVTTPLQLRERPRKPAGWDAY